jgi:hypothetical protein
MRVHQAEAFHMRQIEGHRERENLSRGPVGINGIPGPGVNLSQDWSAYVYNAR